MCMVVCVELLLLVLLSYCRRGTVGVVELASAWNYACVCSCMYGTVVVVGAELLSMYK